MTRWSVHEGGQFMAMVNAERWSKRGSRQKTISSGSYQFMEMTNDERWLMLRDFQYACLCRQVASSGR